MMRSIVSLISFLFFIHFIWFAPTVGFAQQPNRPNIILIYADDLGYGDLSCYGATKINTPNIDAMAKAGIRFTNAHSSSATCTPSRYALMTGRFPWRQQGTGVLPGDAAMIIPAKDINLASLLQQAGYKTGMVGKWHLGLGDSVRKNWNAHILPGPNERGFDYSFIFPATADRVPTVFIENGNIVGADPSDPIMVDYQKKIGNEPTGKENPELLKMRNSPGHGHDNTIVNGIGRIGFMTGGKTARWTDEEMPLTFLEKAKGFIEDNRQKPFFLFYALTEPHVPRMPSTVFKGKSGLGFRGDAILQIDWTVGQIMKQLKTSGLDRNTMIIITSDNGPVLDDGYEDGTVTQLKGHTPWGPLRGGKYSAFEAGTRVPMILHWHGKVAAGKVSDAMVSQVDMLASMASLVGIPLAKEDSKNSENQLRAWLGQDTKGKEWMIKQGSRTLSITKGYWKYIEPSNGPAMSILTNTELGNDIRPQLYNLKDDIGERKNLADQFPALVNELSELLKKSRQ
jgi:arylsulfatase A-like enzyme